MKQHIWSFYIIFREQHEEPDSHTVNDKLHLLRKGWCYGWMWSLVGVSVNVCLHHWDVAMMLDTPVKRKTGRDV